jgi:hypothetical protein
MRVVGELRGLSGGVRERLRPVLRGVVARGPDDLRRAPSCATDTSCAFVRVGRIRVARGAGRSAGCA